MVPTRSIQNKYNVCFFMQKYRTIKNTRVFALRLKKKQLKLNSI